MTTRSSLSISSRLALAAALGGRAAVLLLLWATARAQSSTTLMTPTGVSASDGAYANKIALTWDPVPSARTYRILRSSTNAAATAAEIGTTSSWVFWDAAAAAGQTFHYWVRAESGTAQSALSASDAGFRGQPTVAGTATATLDPPPEPAGNPVTFAKVALGKTLFWDEQLSSTKTVSCGTCHLPEKGFVDSRSVLGAARSRHAGPDGRLGTADDVTGSPGVPLMDAAGNYVWDDLKGFGEQVTGRIARAASDAAYFTELFWDGRANGVFRDPLTNTVVLSSGGALESQAVGPIVNSVEMAQGGRAWEEVCATLAAAWPLALATNIPTGLANWIGPRSYPQLFEDAFGTPDITPIRIAFAIASYERTLFSDRTPFDQANSLLVARPAAVARGLNAFNSETCATCHTGVIFSDGLAHHLGVRPVGAPEDAGRFAVTGVEGDRAKFLTPGLRNVALRGPYLHNGSETTLNAMMDFYDDGGNFNSPANEIRGINLSQQERNDLVAFLQTLTDPRMAARQYPFDRPTLFSESNRGPALAGPGVAGSGNATPRAIAIEPPHLGNTRFTFAVQGGLGGAPAVLVIDTKEPPTDRIPGATEVVGRFALTLAGSGAGNGRAALQWALPGEQAAAGARYYARWYVSDPAAPGGLAASERIDLTLFGEHGTGTAPLTFPSIARLTNLSARVTVGGAGGTPVAGFVVDGTAKRLAVRAVGPALAAFGVTDRLAAPALELVRNGAVIGANAGWLSADAAIFTAVGAFALAPGSGDAALVMPLSAGNTTALIRAADGGTGVALLEAYDTEASETSRLRGLSVRARVGTGSALLIGGLNVQGDGTLKLLLRAVGPGLSAFAVTDVLPDPQITLHRGTAVLASNDDWGAGSNPADVQAAAASVGDFALVAGSKDAALLATVSGGSYTIMVSGVGGLTGIALLEIYVLP